MLTGKRKVLENNFIFKNHGVGPQRSETNDERSEERVSAK